MKTFSVIVTALLVTLCNAESFSCPDTFGTCNKCTNYNGKVLALTRDLCGFGYDQAKCIKINGGRSFTCPDGCNKCSCEDSGVVATQMACSGPNKLNECTDLGTSWKCGENTCYCTPEGIAYGFNQ